MTPTLLALLVAAVAVVGALMALTAAGERRRSRSWGVAIAAGLLFPVAWIVWYVRDARRLSQPHT